MQIEQVLREAMEKLADAACDIDTLKNALSSVEERTRIVELVTAMHGFAQDIDCKFQLGVYANTDEEESHAAAA